jgi:hypothetical protein
MKCFENKGEKFDGAAYRDVVPSKVWSEAVHVSLYYTTGGKACCRSILSVTGVRHLRVLCDRIL